MKVLQNIPFIGVIILLVLSLSCFFLYPSAKTVKRNSAVVQQVIAKPDVPALAHMPMYITIARIGVTARIEHVGLEKDGAIGSPVEPRDAAWFDEGPVPGSIGMAIIDGHSGWKNNIPAVFDNLGKLQEGDMVHIENQEGVISTFVVRKLVIYKKDDRALDVFYSTDNQSHLNLITCAGIWNVLDNGRDDRIVVFTDLVPNTEE